MRTLCLLLILFPAFAGAEEAAQNSPLAEGKQRFETHCGICHSLALPKSQQLDRATWKWVIDDMVNEFGAVWLTAEDQRLILEYVVKHYGPE